MNYLDIKITALKRVNLSPIECSSGGIRYYTLREWINYTRQPNETIIQLRQLAPDPDTKGKNKKQINDIKTQLPCVVVSSLLYSGISESNIIQSLPLLSIDIDAQDNTWITDWQQFKHEFISYLNNGKNIVYCGLSASGLGIWTIIALAYPERIKEQIEAVKRDFNRFSINGHSIKIDTANLGQVAKRFLTYDPEPFINEDPEPYKGLVSQERPKPRGGNVKLSGRNLETILQENNVPYREIKSNGDRQMFAVECPWKHLHSSRNKNETVVFQYYDTKCCGFICQHSHCQDRTFKDYWHEITKR